MTASEIEDPELARYLNRSYWEQKQQEKDSRDKDTDVPTIYPSAPVTAAGPMSPTNSAMKTVEVIAYLIHLFTRLNYWHVTSRDIRTARPMKWTNFVRR